MEKEQSHRMALEGFGVQCTDELLSQDRVRILFAKAGRFPTLGPAMIYY